MPTNFQLGPFNGYVYGLTILVGITAGLLLGVREAGRRGESFDFPLNILPWLFIGSLLGARIWHILTPPESMVVRGITTRYYLTHILDALAIWKGGLSLFGAILGGVLTLWICARRKGQSITMWLDILAPGIALAQIIGSWGGFFNQEAYGLPSTLPWAIFIDAQHRLPGYSEISTYHPLFIYESLWSLLNLAFLFWISRKLGEELKSGSLFLIYLIFSGIGRVGWTFLRLDVSRWQGINLNQTAMSLVVIMACFLLYNRQSKGSGDPDQA